MGNPTRKQLPSGFFDVVIRAASGSPYTVTEADNEFGANKIILSASGNQFNLTGSFTQGWFITFGNTGTTANVTIFDGVQTFQLPPKTAMTTTTVTVIYNGSSFEYIGVEA